MKRNIVTLGSALMISALSLYSCSRTGADPVDPIDPTPPAATMVELKGDLATQTLKKGTKYILKGQTFVRAGQTLTIEPGTVILGDKATKGGLIIDRGAKIIANGTAAEPIVFTSALPAGTRDRGDWLGLIILGKAKVNQQDPAIEGISPAVIYGGTDDADSSGSLKYVRVEFAGIELTPNNETNSFTFGGVGNGTTMDYLMASFGGDDSFEWFGGSVNSKHIVAFAGWDDDFDTDYGFSGTVQFGLGIRYPSYADQSGSNGFESDNDAKDVDVQPYTTTTFSNITILGPISKDGQSINANFQHAMDLRRRTAITIANSVFMGYPRGLRMNTASVLDQYTNNRGVLYNNFMHAPKVTYAAGWDSTKEALVKAYWEANSNTTSTASDYAAVMTSWGLNSNIFFGANTAGNYTANPNFEVASTGTLMNAAKFDNAKLSGNSFLDKTVKFAGAFGADNWAKTWVEFNPINKAY